MILFLLNKFLETGSQHEKKRKNGDKGKKGKKKKENKKQKKRQQLVKRVTSHQIINYNPTLLSDLLTIKWDRSFSWPDHPGKRQKRVESTIKNTRAELRSRLMYFINVITFKSC